MHCILLPLSLPLGIVRNTHKNVCSLTACSELHMFSFSALFIYAKSGTSRGFCCFFVNYLFMCNYLTKRLGQYLRDICDGWAATLHSIS